MFLTSKFPLSCLGWISSLEGDFKFKWTVSVALVLWITPEDRIALIFMKNSLPLGFSVGGVQVLTQVKSQSLSLSLTHTNFNTEYTVLKSFDLNIICIAVLCLQCCSYFLCDDIQHKLMV